MTNRRKAYYISMLAGFLFVVTGARLYFHGDITGVIIHFVLALILFISMLFLGREPVE
jgi:hypothetical protein